MNAPSATFLMDTVIVLQLDASLDADGAPAWNDGTVAPRLAAAVQKPAQSRASRMAPDAMGGAAINSESQFEILFAADPGVTYPGQLIRWVSRKGVPLASPITFTSRGASEPPGGISSRWTVSVSRVTGS